MTESLTPAAGASLRAEGLNVAVGARNVLTQVDVTFAAGRVSALCGPNGCGKSTLLRTLGGLLKPVSGRVWLDDTPLDSLRARRIALLAQTPGMPFGMTVAELVACGRYSHTGMGGRLGERDNLAIERALHLMELDTLCTRDVTALSGGERQRAFIAMALAQEGNVLLLDEPTTYLDVRHQIDILARIRELNRETGMTVVWVLHDLNQAAAFSDAMLLMRDGKLVFSGTPDETMDPDRLMAVFSTPMQRIDFQGLPMCLPVLGGQAGRSDVRESVEVGGANVSDGLNGGRHGG
ncbi:ABC transporter ATP-binding protein [Pandoraea sp. NPDC090278]|uniref:ABC transporter ATP-binding protein n=1 Tax=Pandoraea sp. NPDC090278 TaxID=3364391 RepID=UPI00383AC3B3